jgi:hypothetical protein
MHDEIARVFRKFRKFLCVFSHYHNGSTLDDQTSLGVSLAMSACCGLAVARTVSLYGERRRRLVDYRVRRLH